MLTDRMREAVTTEEMVTEKPLTAVELKTLRVTRGWMFRSSSPLPDGRLRYEFDAVVNKVERR